MTPTTTNAMILSFAPLCDTEVHERGDRAAAVLANTYVDPDRYGTKRRVLKQLADEYRVYRAASDQRCGLVRNQHGFLRVER